ncbi:MAG: 30S ribosomal protein S24e [Candidatus Micrarchaeota archaeon]|nr:30S ribosomal protein S24e [Candidatus Micrarchaeota archaeon]
MDIKINKETENKLLNRKEIVFTVSSKGKTPDKEDLKVQVCKKLNLSPDLTVVVKIDSLYGSSENQVLVHNYATKEAMGIEKKYLFARVAKKGEKAAKAAAAAKPAEESAPAAAPKEEKAAE